MLRKSFYTLLTVLALVVIHSCSKDSESDSSPVQADIVGVWEAAFYSYEGNSSIVYPDDFETSEFTGLGSLLDFNMTFNVDNSYSLIGSYLLEHTTIQNGIQQSSYTIENFNDNGTWSMNGNIITLFLNGEEITAGVSELTESTLVLNINTSTAIVGEDNFTTTTTTTNEVYRFDRVL